MMSAEAVRQVALSLPEVEERETWGEATFRTRDRIFAMLSSSGDTAGLRTSPEEQAELITLDPATFSISHYTGRFGWVTVRLGTVNPDLMRDLVIGAWQRTAPKRLVAAYLASGGSGAR